jgi:hypothetical protein
MGASVAYELPAGVLAAGPVQPSYSPLSRCTGRAGRGVESSDASALSLTLMAPAPRKEGTSGAAGHPYASFQRALKRRNVLMAIAAARDLPQLNLADALELTILVARKDPRRHTRVAARWLLRLLEEDPHATIDEAVLAASSLAALIGVGHEEAATTLRAMAERASSWRRARAR